MTNSRQKELAGKVTEIIAVIPLETGAKLTEIGWERYSENEQEAIEKVVALINQQVREALEEVKSKTSILRPQDNVTMTRDFVNDAIDDVMKGYL